MNATLWVLQALMSITFLYSGVNKSVYSIRKLVDEIGQTGVENLPPAFVRFIGVSEILGAFGLILPWGLHILPWLTPVTAALLAMVMVPAATIHYKRHEPRNVATNVVLFMCCAGITYGRLLF